MLKKATTIHSNIYTLPIFKEIQNMLRDIANNEVHHVNDSVKIEDSELFHFEILPGCLYHRYN